MNRPSKVASANSDSAQELAILEPEALAAWTPELKVEAEPAANTYHAPLLDAKVVDELDAATAQSNFIPEQDLFDATVLSMARWARVHCAQINRAHALLSRLSQSEHAQFCSASDHEVLDRSQDLQALKDALASEDLTAPQRCWTAIELGLLYEECGFEPAKALACFQEALEACPDHLGALELAWRSALAHEDMEVATGLLQDRLALEGKLGLDTDPGLRRAMGELLGSSDEVREHLEEIHHISPSDQEVAQRRIAWAFIEGSYDTLSEMFWSLAQQDHEQFEIKVSALHLTMLTRDAQTALDERVVTEVLATYEMVCSQQGAATPSANAMMRELLEHLPVDGQSESKTRMYCRVFGELVQGIDDPRDAALVHERLARMELSLLRKQPPQELTEQGAQAALQSLQVCADMLPDLRWNREATAEVLKLIQNYPALAQHYETWASDTTHALERANLLLRAGQVYENDLGEFALALECYRQAHAEQPRDPNCLRSLGGCYARSGQWNDAISVLHQQVDQSGDADERIACLRRIVSIAREQIHDADLALASLQQISEIRPDDVGTLYLTAIIARREDRMGVLVDALKRLLDVTCDVTSQCTLASELATVLDRRLDRHEEAMHWHAHALTALPGFDPSRRELTRLKVQRGELQEAMALYFDREPAQMSPSTVFSALSVADQLDRGDPMRIELYCAACDLLAPSPALHTQTARMLMDSGDPRRAYTLLDRLSESRFAALASEQHFDLACASARLERSDQEHQEHWQKSTQRHYKRCVELEPEHFAALEELYHTYSTTGDLDGLDALYETVQEQADPVSKAQFLTQRARMAAHRGRPEAKALYEQALSLRPDDAILRFELEQLLRASALARPLFNNLVRQAGEIGDPKLKAALAICAAETLLDASSGAEIKTVGRLVLSALKSDPGNPHAVAMLEQVLNLDATVVPVRAAVSARAVRAQSDEERAIFFAESAELLETAGLFADAKHAYEAAVSLVSGTQILESCIQEVASARPRSEQTEPDFDLAKHQAAISAEHKNAVQKAIEDNDEELAGKIVAQLTSKLVQDPDHAEAIYLLVQLASAHLQRPGILRNLAQLFPRLSERSSRYRVGVLLGVHVEDPSQGISYLSAALVAKPDGLSAREALLGRYRELELADKQAETIRALLSHPRFAEARKPALQRELVYLLADDLDAGREALRHCAELLREHTRDTGLIQLYSQLLEQQDRSIDAARALDPLLRDSPSAALIHAVRLRQAQLYAKRHDTLEAAMHAIQSAVAARPDEPESLSMMLSLYERARRMRDLEPLIENIRVATVQRMTRGSATVHDLDHLSRLLASNQHPATRRIQVLKEALTPQVLAPRTPSLSQRTHQLFQNPQARARARSSEEPGALMDLLSTLEPKLVGLSPVISDLGPASSVVLPLNAPISGLEPLVHAVAQSVGIAPPTLTASAGPTICSLLTLGAPELRISRDIWAMGDLEIAAGALYVASARGLFQGALIRSIRACDMDLLLAASFDAVGIFHPITAEPDASRLSAVGPLLARLLNQHDKEQLRIACESLQHADLAPGAAKAACLKSDLRLSVLLSKDPRCILLTAAAFEGVSQGSPMERITQSGLASALLGDFLSDDAMNRH